MSRSLGPTARRKPRFRERHRRPTAVAPGEVAERIPAPTVKDSARPGPGAHLSTPHVVRLGTVPRLSREQGLYAGIVLFGFLIRIWDVGSRAMHGDEAVHAWLAWNLYSGTGYQYDPVYHGPLQFIVTSAFFFLFSPSNAAGRLMAVIFGTALIALPYFLRRWMGRREALVASALIAISPAFVYVSRLERDDIFTAFFALTLAISVFGLISTQRPRYLYLGAASIALSLAAMENTYITLFVFATFLLLVLAGESMATQRRWGINRLWATTGSEHNQKWQFVGGYLVILALAFATTVALGFALPVLVVLAAGIAALAVRQAAMATVVSGSPTVLNAFRGFSRMHWVNAITLMIGILVLAYSVFGTDPRGIWDAAQPLFNANHACTENSFILNPCRKDILGGLFYWLSQHQVHRGGQPWFYYPMLFGLYEQIAVVFGLSAMIWFARKPTLFSAFLTYWGVLMFGVYSWAGEKFSWLMIHPLVPFTLLAAMFVVDMARRAGTVRVVIAALLALLVVVEVHSTWEVNFVNGADPVEMMVYVQSSPQSAAVADNIIALSNKLTGGNDIHVSIDSSDTWPFAWYLRGMPNVAYPAYPQIMQKPFSTNPVIIVDEEHQTELAQKLHGAYTGHRYRLRWWFPEDYKQLSWSSFAHDAVNPSTWSVIGRWFLDRRPFGPKQAVWFYYYVKNGLASPY